jgi:hypothetical protein
MQWRLLKHLLLNVAPATDAVGDYLTTASQFGN